MNSVLVRRAVAGLSLGALAAAGLATVPSPVHAAVEEAQIGGYSYVNSGCGENEWNDPEVVPWADDNVPVTASYTNSQTYDVGDGDVVEATASSSATVTSSPLGSGPATITARATATASAQASGDQTDCSVNVQSNAAATGFFTLTQPMWVTLTATGQGDKQGTSAGTSYVAIGSADEFNSSWDGLFFLGGDSLMLASGNRGAGVSTTLLPAGQYGVGFAAVAMAQAEGADEGSASFTGNFKVDLKPAGTALPVTGKGASKVQFGERDCASGNVPVSLSKKTVKKAKKVKFRVDGKKALVLKGKKLSGKKPTAKSVVLPTAAAGLVKVKVKVVLDNGRRMQATRSYLPCR